CLAKQPGERYASYAALASALEPFRSASLTPARLGRRFLAGWIDTYAAALPMMPLNMYLGARFMASGGYGATVLFGTLPTVAVTTAYYTILEGRFGCAAGKAIFNLRVIDGSHSAPGYRRALFRALLFILPTQLTDLAIGYFLMRLVTKSGFAPGNAMMSLVALFSAVMSFVW